MDKQIPSTNVIVTRPHENEPTEYLTLLGNQYVWGVNRLMAAVFTFDLTFEEMGSGEIGDIFHAFGLQQPSFDANKCKLEQV